MIAEPGWLAWAGKELTPEDGCSLGMPDTAPHPTTQTGVRGEDPSGSQEMGL